MKMSETIQIVFVDGAQKVFQQHLLHYGVIHGKRVCRKLQFFSASGVSHLMHNGSFNVCSFYSCHSAKIGKTLIT
jgi:hypothetical protein